MQKVWQIPILKKALQKGMAKTPSFAKKYGKLQKSMANAKKYCKLPMNAHTFTIIYFKKLP